MNPSSQDDLHERIGRLLDGEMQQAEADALDAELRACPRARAQYLQLAALHSALESQFGSRSKNQPGRIIPIELFLSRQRRRTVRIALMAAAAVLALAAIPLWLTMAKSREVLANFQTTNGDAALLIDSVSISRAVPRVPDGGFELSVLPPNQFAQAVRDPSLLLDGSPWKFVGGAGIIHNGSNFASPPAPEGSQAAVLQGLNASMECVFNGFEPDVTYRLHLQAASRQEGFAELRITLDGTPLRFRNAESLHPTSRKYQTFVSDDFQATGEISRLRIESTTTGTTFLDDIHFEFIAEAGQ